MKVTAHIEKAKKPFFSLEVLPPLKGESIDNLFKHIDPLMEFKPPFINITYHREEYVYKKRANGLLEKTSIRKRPGTVGICSAITHRYNVDTVPHIICGGFSREETENALIDLNFLGIQNVLALRGDPIKSEPSFKAEPDGHQHAVELIKQVVDMNNGKYLASELESVSPTDFCIGAAGYPEKHFEAPNKKSDMKYLKQKVENGANYIVTQMFFDNQKYFDFVKACREEGITVPIIPGLKPITTKRQVNVLPRLFCLDIPEELVLAIEKCKDNEAAAQVGIEWAIQQSRGLIEFGVPCLHFYSMGKSDSVQKVATEVF